MAAPSSASPPSLEATLAQRAGRAFATAMAPGLPWPALAHVAGVRLLEHDLDQLLAAQLGRELPGLRLVEPHQRRVQHEAAVHAEIERDLQRLQRVVAAIGIAREVGLAHAAHEVPDVTPPGDRGGESK